MPYDEGLAQRIRDQLTDVPDVVERKMFGGLAFMVTGHMAVGVNGYDLMVRVGPEKHETALARPGARPMDFTGRPLKGFVFVAPEGVADDPDLATWVESGVAFAHSLPPK